MDHENLLTKMPKLPPLQKPRKKALRRVFNAGDHIRTDWGNAYVIEFLEERARGYDGTLRQILCTAAAMLRRSEDILKEASREEALTAEETERRATGELDSQGGM